MENQVQVKFKITLSVYGVKKRCRKSEGHNFHLGHIDYNEGVFNKEEILDKARAAIETNMKSCVKAAVTLNYVEIKKEEHFTSTLWQPFDDRHVKFNVETPLIEQLN